MQAAAELLQRVFGYQAFRGKQQEIIQHLLSGHSCLVLMPTGGGKSLCFQIPAMLRPGLGLVISPLIALMQDQVDALKVNGVRAEFYNSSMDKAEKNRVRMMANSGALDLLYAAPETLNGDSFRGFLEGLTLSLIAVDEAHCVSQWGHDFRPEYLNIASLRESFPAVPLVALTATADELTRKEIQKRLGLAAEATFASSFDRPNIHYQITLKDNGKEQLYSFLKERHQNDAGIIYCLSRKKVEDTAAWLQSKGIAALPYHAGLDAAVRRETQARFNREEGLIIVATIAFGMGIDKPNVRFVAHLDLPKSVESYYQETGRAGRDGEAADAWMAYGLGDVVQLMQLIQSGEGAEDFKRLSQQKLSAMLGLCETVGCRRQTLLAYFGEKHGSHCGNCDNCNNPPKTWDATTVAQKALSCIGRSNQRFGAGHLIDILLGRETEKVARNGHQQLSVFGIGKELGKAQWNSVYRQLAAGNYLEVDVEGFGVFKLNASSWRVLKEGATVWLREDPPARTKRTDRKLAVAGELQDVDSQAFDVLRRLRMRLAKEQNLPPYVIFHDATLREMIVRRPGSLYEMARVPGIGESKLKLYGAEFLSVLCETLNLKMTSYAATPPREKANTTLETLRLFQTGATPRAVASARGLTESTIWNHLSKLIEEGKLSREQVLPMPAEEVRAILDAFAEADGRLKPVFDKFNGRYPYEALKIILASADP